MYETPKCCKTAENGGVYWVPGWYDGPDKDGWAIERMHSYNYPLWVNVNYCPYCGTKLKLKDE